MSVSLWEIWEARWALAPPWRRWRHGVLVRVPGPRSLTAYNRVCRDYEESTMSGRGLWDESENQRTLSRLRVPVCRIDNADLQEYVEKHGDELPARMREVYIWCIERGVNARVAGATMGISDETVRVHLRLLRARCRAAMIG